jgi:putative addiction module component (TIGR02574 family)
MSPTREAVLEAALHLREDDRVVLVEALLDSLSPDDAVADDDVLAAELEARYADFERSGGEAISWDELKRQQ